MLVRGGEFRVAGAHGLDHADVPLGAQFLNDGANGNPRSWILGERTGWVQLEFGRAVHICRIGFASDVQGRYTDRAITAFDLQVPDGEGWRTIYSYAGAPVIGYRRFSFQPVRTVILRLVIRDSIRGQPRIDELEVFGSDEPITPEQAAPPPDPNAPTTNRLERAALGERFILAPGLPGKTAPISAGKLIAKAILDILKGEKIK